MQIEDYIKEKQLNDLYGEYVDCEPCFPPAETLRVQLPFYITPVDRTYIKLSEERAKETARFYRDRSSDLKAKVLRLEHEKRTRSTNSL